MAATRAAMTDEILEAAKLLLRRQIAIGWFRSRLHAHIAERDLPILFEAIASGAFVNPQMAVIGHGLIVLDVVNPEPVIGFGRHFQSAACVSPLTGLGVVEKPFLQAGAEIDRERSVRFEMAHRDGALA